MSATPHNEIALRHLEQVKRYVSTALETGDGTVTVDEIASNTPIDRMIVAAILDTMAERPRTGIVHVAGDTYEIARRG